MIAELIKKETRINVEVFMNLKDCYRKLGGDYDDVLTRLYSEDMIKKISHYLKS